MERKDVVMAEYIIEYTLPILCILGALAASWYLLSEAVRLTVLWWQHRKGGWRG